MSTAQRLAAGGMALAQSSKAEKASICPQKESAQPKMP